MKILSNILKRTLMVLMMVALGVTAQGRLLQHDTVRVACIGNSITYGTGLENPTVDSYPAQLQRLLGDKYLVGNFGKPSATLARQGYMPYMQQEEFHKAMRFGADIAVIHLGVNDTDPRVWPNHRDEFVADYSALIDSVRKSNPECHIIIARLTPLSDRHRRFQSGTRDWHAQIQQAIETVARVKGCALIDFYDPLHCRPDLFPDAIHPNKEGYGIMAGIVYSAITGDYGGLQLPSCYSDNMVLPRNRAFHINGKANSGEKVVVKIASQKHETTANNRGEWSVRIDPLSQGGPYELKVEARSRDIKMENIMAGELWLCSGQSNMQFMLKQCSTANEDIVNADCSDIRLLDLKGRWSTDGQAWSKEALDSTNQLKYYEPATWQLCSPETAAQFSAIGYQFARELHDSLQCPIGVVCNAVGGSGIEAWIDRTTVENDMPDILKDWTHNDFIQDWVRERAEANMGKDHAALQRHPYQPCYLYEASIQDLKALPINGVIWYQGESNAHCIESHEKMFGMLLKSWRETWKNDQLPFLYVQLSSLNRPSWTWFRDSQRRLLGNDSHLGMAVSSDVGDSLNVHPTNKRPVAHRLVLWALHNEYGHENLTPSGPLFQSAEFRGKDVVVTMRYGKGMHALDEGEIKTFEVASEEGCFWPAHAEVLEDNILRVWSDSVKNPTLVRYGWQPFTRANLVNSDWLPASTFRAEKDGDDIRVATMNMRYENSSDEKKGHGWKVRRELIGQFIHDNALDIIGSQETLHGQVSDLKKLLPEYSMVGVGRDNGRLRGEYAAVWFRTDRFEDLDHGFFWLSDTPDKAGSIGWDAACVRMATWVKLLDKQTDKELFVVDTHMDHQGATARREGAKLIISRIEKLADGLPVILTGDMNVSANSEAYRTLTTGDSPLTDVMELTPQHFGVDYTFHNFNRIPVNERQKIDFIFVTSDVKVLSTAIEAPNPDALASDHCFHVAQISTEK